MAVRVWSGEDGEALSRWNEMKMDAQVSDFVNSDRVSERA